MILARKDGWLIAVQVLEENETFYHLKAFDQKEPFIVHKSDTYQRLFDSTDDAITWINKSLPTSWPLIKGARRPSL